MTQQAPSPATPAARRSPADGLVLLAAAAGLAAGLVAAAAHASTTAATVGDDAHRVRSRELLAQGEDARAVFHLRRHLEAIPDDVGARADLAAAYGRLGLRQSALQEAALVLAERPDDPAALGALAGVQLSDGRPEEALVSLDRAAGPEDDGRRLLRAKALVALGRHEEAREPLERLAADRPEDASLHNLLGLSALQAGDRASLERAAVAFTRAAELEPGRAAYRNNLGFALERLGRLEEAFLAYVEAEGLPGGSARHATNRQRVEHALARR